MNTKHVGVKVAMLAGVAVVAVVVAMSATAEPGRRGGKGGGHGGGHGDGACAEDAKRLCADVDKGEGRVHECLQSKISEVSAECSAKMARGAEHHAKREAFKAACGDQIKQLCGADMGPPPGEGPDDDADADARGPGRGKHKEMKACIDAHEAELTAECRAVIADAKAEHEGRKGHRGEVREACEADVKAFCADVASEGKGKGNKRAIRECLQTHERQLSGECSAAISAARPE